MKNYPLLALVLVSLGGCTLLVDSREQEAECLHDTDCPTANPCEGPRMCSPMTHTCISVGAAPTCDDSEPCTADSCDPSVTGGCVHVLNDSDLDTFAPQTCASGAYQGGDCDDTNSSVRPGAPEQCGNSIDDNCNGTVDTDAPANITCFADADDDGFHNPNVMTSAGCACPAGYITPNPMGPDCADGVNSAHLGQTGWFDHPYCKMGTTTAEASLTMGGTYVCLAGYYPSFDYNCVGGDEQLITASSSTCYISSLGGTVISTFSAKAGTVINPTFTINRCYARWSSSAAVPACGATGDQWQCASSSSCNAATTPGVVQQCH